MPLVRKMHEYMRASRKYLYSRKVRSILSMVLQHVRLGRNGHFLIPIGLDRKTETPPVVTGGVPEWC